MKFALVLILALALTSQFSQAKKVGGSSTNRKPSKTGIIGSIIDYGKKNSDVTIAFVSALQEDATLSSKVIGDTSLNTTALKQYFFSVVSLSSIQSFLEDYIIPVFPSYAPTITATVNIVNGLISDNTNQTVFAGDLISEGYVSYTSGTVPILAVNYDSVQNDVNTYGILNTHIEKKVKGCVKKGSVGPFGKFKNSY